MLEEPREAQRVLDKQRALKRALSRGDYTPLTDSVARLVEKWVQKLTRSSQSIPYWYSALLVALAILFVSFGTSILVDAFTELDELSRVRRARIPSEIALVGLTFVGSLILKIQLDAIYALWQRRLIDAVQSVDHLTTLENWFKTLAHKRIQWTWGVIGGGIFGYYVMQYVVDVRGDIGLGPRILILLINVQLFLGLYYIGLFLDLPYRIRTFDMDLFSLNPRRSEIVHLLSRVLFNFVYGWAAFVAAISLVLGVFATMDRLSVLILLAVGWLPIIAAFVLNQYALTLIINRAKWRKLNEIQQKIEALEANRDLVQKETMEEMNRLLDFHNRIWSSRSSVIDVESVVGFANALLLPLITSLLSIAASPIISRLVGG